MTDTAIAAYPKPWISDTMRRVTRDEFFAALTECTRDVMPTLSGSGAYDNATGYTSEWRDHSRALFGVSDAGTHLCQRRYWLAK